ncbi:hypothetical protein BP00DRAFT_51845 [Aspergillus indologenus CBS 114.80]|uniref:Uncharacterized protein n=1 Tax=Aspergillus indologenus CBS 114.80 TaxID=1450541 RepID=A0A2V5HX32_9EURO|nr:hypothetical protein BP00DRAFT_51845 [Aspergillus indologenus CBS 114.80]
MEWRLEYTGTRLSSTKQQLLTLNSHSPYVGLSGSACPVINAFSMMAVILSMELGTKAHFTAQKNPTFDYNNSSEMHFMDNRTKKRLKWSQVPIRPIGQKKGREREKKKSWKKANQQLF